MPRRRDIGTFSPKRDASTKFLLSGLREPFRRGGKFYEQEGMDDIKKTRFSKST